jgi:hypothetical protein
MSNRISIVLTAEQEQAIIEKIGELAALLPDGLVTLADGEAESLPKLGDKSLGFVEKSLDAAVENPAVCPPFVDPEELRRDLDAYKKLNRLKRALERVVAPVSDSATLAGSEAYTASLSIYGMAKDGARRGVAGAKEISGNLSERFPGRAKAPKKE